MRATWQKGEFVRRGVRVDAGRWVDHGHLGKRTKERLLEVATALRRCGVIRPELEL
jgi:hypothetical protein